MERYEEGRMDMGRDGESEKQREGGVSPDEQIKRRKEKEKIQWETKKSSSERGITLSIRWWLSV